MEFGVLGPLRVAQDGRDEVIGSRAQRVVLASLLAHPGEVVGPGALVEAVWGDDAPPSALNTLRSQVSRLRRIVGDRLVAGPDGYELRPGPDDGVDAARFDLALRRMRSDPGATSRAVLTAALSSWRGAAFGELADVDTVRATARRLELARLDAVEVVAAADLEAGRWADAVAGAEDLVAADPVREPGWEVLVRALGAAGRTADAMRAARRAVGALAEAGLQPGAGLRAAEAAVLTGEGSPGPAPARATASRSNRPRAPLTATVGRADELARALQALDDGRLVTIVGPGGVGKTRLAIDVAIARADAHARGSVLVELSRVADAAGVASTIAAALELRSPAGGERAALGDLGALDALVVLDNCEHVIDAVVPIVPDLLAGGDQLRIVTTSREPLAIAGEQVLALRPLPTDGDDAPAVRLFRQLAAAAGPVGEADEALLGALVARLDGLPLALEMAAARLRTMTLAELAVSIDDDLDVLATPRRDVDERHRTLRDLLAWSERLLDPELRDALHDFSVFAGPVRGRDLPAAISTVRPADTIARLVDRSLVLAQPGPDGVRFGVLETVRSYGRERLRADGCRRRGATPARRVVRDPGRRDRRPGPHPGRGGGADPVRRDRRRAAGRRALVDRRGPRDRRRAGVPLVPARSHGAALRGRVVGRRRRRAPPGGPPGPCIGCAASWPGACRRWAASRTRRASARRSAAPPGRAWWRCRRWRAWPTPPSTKAGSSTPSPATEAIALAEAAGESYYVDLGRVCLALAVAYGGDVAGARAHLADGPACPSPSAAAWYEYSRGEIALDTDPAAALDHLDRAVGLARSVGDRYVTEVALLSSSSLRARTGDLAAAVDRFAELLEHFGVGGDPGHLVTSLRNLVTLLVRLGQYRPAATLYGTVVDHPSSPTYGAEAERLAAAAEECRDALGEQEFARVVELGRQRTLDSALAAAAGALRAARARVGSVPA